ncbi:hypothetical protein ABZ342_36315 [Amycolatopsis sp. NPDC005961]|uniref:hypothetical protein n=1 Tax=Amycolatopsis sp. NPDC005961 TaxID=3156720 RepID=UPI0033F049F0
MGQWAPGAPPAGKDNPGHGGFWGFCGFGRCCEHSGRDRFGRFRGLGGHSWRRRFGRCWLGWNNCCRHRRVAGFSGFGHYCGRGRFGGLGRGRHGRFSRSGKSRSGRGRFSCCGGRRDRR